MQGRYSKGVCSTSDTQGTVAIRKTTLSPRTIKRKRAQIYQKPKALLLFSESFVLVDDLLEKMSTFINEFPLVKSLSLSLSRATWTGFYLMSDKYGHW